MSMAPEPQGCVFEILAQHIVELLLGVTRIETGLLREATVHLPNRGTKWVAVFTGPEGGQVWRSTGLTDRDQALLVARKWEAEARTERVRSQRAKRKEGLRIRRGEGGLTQKEVALLLGLSERGVRAIERRALRKIFNHPALRRAWAQYLAGDLDEDQSTLTGEEVEALLALVRTPEERRLLVKVLCIFGYA